MNLEATLEMAVRGRLYPSVILHGSTFEGRTEAALEIGRALLCGAQMNRPCGECRHCRRIVWPEPKAGKFHPDLHVLERDLRATTSIDATRDFLKSTVATPFEARGQVFVIAEAETLGAGAADTLLKTLEEPPTLTPRNFLLLAGSQHDLPRTLRSRSLSLYLGGSEQLDEELVREVAEELGPALDAYFETTAPVLLLSAAAVLSRLPGWEDTRAKKPWALAAAAVLSYARSFAGPAVYRRALLALAQDLLSAFRLRLRMISAERILEGLISRHLSSLPTVPSARCP